MLIPSIDLMGGKIVQLVQGEKKALEFDDFEPWIERFARYPLVQIIDLDAAIGQGDNRALVRALGRRLAGDHRIFVDQGWEYSDRICRATRE